MLRALQAAASSATERVSAHDDEVRAAVERFSSRNSSLLSQLQEANEQLAELRRLQGKASPRRRAGESPSPRSGSPFVSPVAKRPSEEARRQQQAQQARQQQQQARRAAEAAALSRYDSAEYRASAPLPSERRVTVKSPPRTHRGR